MKKMLAIFLLILFPSISFAEPKIQLDCREIAIDGTDYGKNTFIFSLSVSHVGDAINYNDFLADEQGNTYQLLGDTGSMYIKVNDQVSPKYNYIYNNMSDFGVHKGKILFKVYDSNRKQFLVYFDGKNFHKTESFDNILSFELSPDGLEYAFIVMYDKFYRELYLNNEVIDSGMIAGEFAFSKNGKSFSYVKLSGEMITNPDNGATYLPDVGVHKDGVLIKTFENSSYHIGSMRYFGNSSAIGLGVFTKQDQETTYTNGLVDNYIFTRDGEIYDFPGQSLGLRDVLYNEDGSKFYTNLSEKGFSYFTDGERRSSGFDPGTIEDIKINLETGKTFFFATMKNNTNPVVPNRYFVYDWKEVMDTSSLVKEHEKEILEKKSKWSTDMRVYYGGSFFGKNDNFYTIDSLWRDQDNNEYSLEYYIRKNVGEHQRLDIGVPYEWKVGVFDNSFGYFIKDEETQGGVYHACNVSETGSQSFQGEDTTIFQDSNSISSTDNSDKYEKFEVLMRSKLDIIDTKLSAEKRVSLYNRLKSALEGIPENKRNYKMEILLELSEVYYKKAIKEYILGKR